MEKFKDSCIVNVLLCKHIYHAKCAETWFDSETKARKAITCPMCRQPVI